MSRDDSSVSCDARAIGALVVRSPRCAAPRAKPCFAGPEVGAYSGARDYLYQTCLCLPQRTDTLTLIASQAVFEMEVIAFTGAFPTGPDLAPPDGGVPSFLVQHRGMHRKQRLTAELSTGSSSLD